MRFGIEEGILLTNLDAKGFDILNCPYLEAENTISTIDPKLDDPRTPPAGSVTNESVAKDAAIAQSKLAFADPMPIEWIGTDPGLAAPGELVEHISNKNAINGYAGLGTDGKMTSGTVPVSGSGTVTAVKFVFPPELSVSVPISASPLVDGDPVTLFPDVSGHGHDATQSGAACPIFKTNVLNGHPVIRVATGQFLNLPSPLANTGIYQIFVVMRAALGQSIFPLNGNGGATLPHIGLNTDNRIYIGFFDGTTMLGGSPVITRDAAFHVYTMFQDELNFLLDGVSKGQSWAGSGAPVGPMNRMFFSTDNGDLAELIAYLVPWAVFRLKADQQIEERTPPVMPQRADIEAYLGQKYGITVAGGTPIDPSTVPNLAAWWKADTPMTKPPVNTVYWNAAPPESWFGVNPIYAGPGVPYPGFNRLPFPEDMIPVLDAAKVTSGIVAHEQLPPDTLLSTPGDGMEGHESDYYARDGTYKTMKATSYQPTLPDPSITVASYQSGSALINLTSSTGGVTFFANTILGSPDTFIEVTKQPIKAIPGKMLSVYTAKIGWTNSNIVTYEIPDSPLSGFDVTLPPPL